MDRAQPGGDGSRRGVAYIDAQGQLTREPRLATRGEIVEYDAHGQPRWRTPFVVGESRVRPLPVSEAAFLVWVLVGLIAVWLAIGVLLRLT
jgi:hypothetical protein